MAERRELKISVRNLVEFIFREGDINSTGLGTRNPEAMQLGNKIHKKIQKSMGIGYQAEVLYLRTSQCRVRKPAKNLI